MTLFVFQEIRSGIITAWRSPRGIETTTSGVELEAVQQTAREPGGTTGVTMQTRMDCTSMAQTVGTAKGLFGITGSVTTTRSRMSR